MFVPIVAFLFNWIGFCLSFCLTNTIAGRYGAICGFGLSLIKWILIVRVCSAVFYLSLLIFHQQLLQVTGYCIALNIGCTLPANRCWAWRWWMCFSFHSSLTTSLATLTVSTGSGGSSCCSVSVLEWSCINLSSPKWRICCDLKCSVPLQVSCCSSGVSLTT